MGLSVRRAGPEEGDALRAIRLEALSDSPGSFGSTYEEAVRRTPESWRAQLLDAANFFGEVDGRVRAMALGGTHEDQPDDPWLFGMYVGPDARGTGLADLLVDAVEEWARASGARRIYLSVVAEQARALAFYRRRGFVEHGPAYPLRRDDTVSIQDMVHPLD